MKIVRTLFCLALVSFFLHILWETSHVSLYTGYENLPFAHSIEWYATGGDVVYTLVVILFFSLVKGGFSWLQRPRGRDYALLAFAGFFLALFVEYKALALGRWEYLPSMPVIPFLEVGLSPIVQMTLLLPLSVWIATYLGRRFSRQN